MAKYSRCARVDTRKNVGYLVHILARSWGMCGRRLAQDGRNDL